MLIILTENQKNYIVHYVTMSLKQKFSYSSNVMLDKNCKI